MLAFWPGGRRASIEALEESFVRIKPTPHETFLLAQLYEADRNWARANELFLSLVQSRHGATPEMTAKYVKAPLSQNRAVEARTWLAKLEQTEPNGARTIELKGRLLKAEHKDEESGRILLEFARREYALQKDPAALFKTATLLSDLGRPVEAETLYRSLVAETEKSHPENLLSFATFLAAQNRRNEALNLCVRASSCCPPETVASVAVDSLRHGEATESDSERVRAMLESALRKKPDAVGLLVARAEWFDACFDYEGTERVYRDVLTRDPNNVVALNNLAWLLGARDPRGEEALSLVERAIEQAGPDGAFLDTRGSVLLVLGRPQDAIKNLEDAVEQTPTGARYFHLSRALERAGRHEAARETWLKATREFSLQEKGLHPLEWAEFAKLAGTMGPR